VSLEAQSIDWPGAEPCPTIPLKVVRNSTALGALVASLSKGTVQPEIPGAENALNELIADRTSF